MKIAEAFEIVALLASQYRGTLKEHETLQTALKVLKESCAEKQETPNE